MGDDSSLSVDGPSTLGGALVMLVVGLAVTGFGAYDYTQQSDAVADAVDVDAVVVETGVEATSTGSAGADYRPTVEFTYEYDGESYTSTNVFPSTTSPTYDTESAARDVLADYESGDSVSAHVDPADPDSAFLLDRTSNAPLLFAGIGLLFVAVGGVSAARRVRRR
ncbi:DUF3592 domain-containing protein [Halobaculum marinum]|uniref:DUF3592 domain-containing protein n=1 Tax=Halobaculum marinum TaxID=3031996 RepID=A0ABD5WWM7_9EURY|nr:DUF3592 domain-containing protein [Halobaculum sp. DT55]